MKITIEVDVTPEEAKNMLNLPDLSGVIEEEVKKKISTWTHTRGSDTWGPFWDSLLLPTK